MLKKLIDAAICRNECDIVLKNAQYVDVFCGAVRKGDIAIKGNRIVGIGEYKGEREYDMSGLTVLPGFIDAHVHIESSQLTPEGFASLVVPRGTTTVIADPHEIANVCGADGIEYMLLASKNTPLDVRIMMPSCVPATPFENNGATISGGDISRSMGEDYVFGLGEFMNYPAVIAGDSEALEKLEAAHSAGKPCDGHAPSLTGNELNAYLCAGITTDHECSDAAEIEEKLSKGMYIALRHGSSARNLQSNCKYVTAGNARRFIMCTDDRHAADLAERGHIDDALRTAVAAGLDGVTAVTIATLNAAECYGLKWRGAVAPNYIADLAVVDNLKDFNVKYVFKNGSPIVRNGRVMFDVSPRYMPRCVQNTVHIPALSADDFKLALRGERAKAIKVNGGSIVTDCEVCSVKSQDGDVVLGGTDLLKLAVIERHKLTGNIGRGLLKGYGFKGGALGITVSHDSHNLIVLGDDNGSMAEVANALAKVGGGMALHAAGRKEARVIPLDVGGLMSSDKPQEFIKKSQKLYALARSMGVNEGLDAFLSLAFLSLAVVPHLKLLDTGLFDVGKFAPTDIEA